MILENIRKFIKHFGKGRRLKMVIFFLMSCVAAFLEFIGIALIYPIILLMLNQERFIGSQKYLLIQNITHSSDAFINAMFIGFCVLMVFIFKNLFMIIFLKMQWKFVTYWKRDIRKIFLEYFLYADYNKILKTSYADKNYISVQTVNMVVENFIMRFFNLLTNSIIIVVIVALLLWKFPTAAFATIIFISGSIYLQNKFFKRKSLYIGKMLNSSSKESNQSLFELLNNLKEIIIFSTQEHFFKRYLDTENRTAKYSIEGNFYNAIPPYIVEILIVSSLLILTAVISIQNNGDSSIVIASLAIIGASMFRIAPALNRVQSSILNMNLARNFVIKLIEEYERYDLANFKINKPTTSAKWNLRDSIELKNLSFAYDVNPIIKNLTFKINKGDFIGIIGLSGAGKSTLADIIMGLLKPQSGEIYVDGVKLTDANYPDFRKSVAYVPQQTMVLEGSFRENVAWGVESCNIDDELVIKSLKMAQFYDFVSQFPEGINASPIIGTNGLSQGQKQRLAIARALYREPDLIIFDEATSSLDVQAEHDITEMLNSNIAHAKTMIAIAHRLSTLKACNKLLFLRDGELVDVGTFAELSAKYPDFDNLVKLSSLN